MTALMRRLAKVVNFCVIYGISAFGLAERLEMSQEGAAKNPQIRLEGIPLRC